MELLDDGCNMVSGASICEFLEVSIGNAIENAIAVIKSGGYEGVNEYLCRGVTERGAEMGKHSRAGRTMSW